MRSTLWRKTEKSSPRLTIFGSASGPQGFRVRLYAVVLGLEVALAVCTLGCWMAEGPLGAKSESVSGLGLPTVPVGRRALWSAPVGSLSVALLEPPFLGLAEGGDGT